MSGGDRFAGRVCLVTGSTGIAEAAAEGMAAEGGSVFVVSRTAEHARALADRIHGQGARSGWAAADLRDEDQVSSAVDACVRAFGRLDAVYNVAGISGRRFGDGPLHEMTVEGWREVLENNVQSMFLVCRSAVRRMLAQEAGASGQRGAILNMSSAVARSPSPVHFATHAYAASKGAIEAFTLALASYYAPHGIRVNAIAPSLVATPMSGRAQGDPTILEYVARKQPLARGIIDPGDLTAAALFLLSDESRLVTGQVLAVDAGWSVTEA